MTESKRFRYGLEIVADLFGLPDWVTGLAGLGTPALGVVSFLLGSKRKADLCPNCGKNDEWRFTGGFVRNLFEWR